MPQFMLLLYRSETAAAGRSGEASLWAELNEALREAGVLAGSGRLHPADTATTVRVRDDLADLTDGPFAVTKEELAGFYLLECADLDEALSYAARFPLARYGSVEVRPVAGDDAASPGPPATEQGPGSMTAGDQRGSCRGDPAAAVARAFREERAAVLATLIRQAGDFQLAEDALQDAFADAITAWQRDGIPANPGAWIMVAARRRTIDRLRRDRSIADRAGRLAELARLAAGEDAGGGGDHTIADDRLRLIFTCCHPALDVSARVALTLRVVGGLATGEIARAFLVNEPTMGKRIVRAKRKIAAAHIPYRVPGDDELPGRLHGVLRVIYLIFNEGYAATAGDQLVRTELCQEAIRLGQLLCELMPGEPEAWGLQALMLLHDARRAARVDAQGAFVALGKQDRSLWDEARIGQGLRALERALRLRRPGEYQLQAAITALHVQPGGTETAGWAQVAELYGALAELSPSPVVEVNRAAAAGFAYGPEAGLQLLGPLLAAPALQRYQPLHAAHAELLRRAGRRADAIDAYRRAIALSGNSIERAELERRLRALTAG